MARFYKSGAVDDARDPMFPLTSVRQVTTGSLAPLDESQRHGWTGKADSHSWNQAARNIIIY